MFGEDTHRRPLSFSLEFSLSSLLGSQDVVGWDGAYDGKEMDTMAKSSLVSLDSMHEAPS